MSSRLINSDLDYEHEWTIIVEDREIILDEGYEGCYSVTKDELLVSYDSTEWNNFIMVF